MTHGVFLPFLAGAGQETPGATVCVLLNAQREVEGVHPLVIFSCLATAAEEGGAWLVESPVFQHDPEWANRVWRHCPSLRRIGENIAGGYTSPESVMRGWNESPPHRDNMMDGHFTHVGVGYAKGGVYGHYWVMNLGATA